MKFKYRNRSIRLTPEGVLFLILVLLVGVTAINTGNNLLYLLMALMLTLIMISGILSEWSLKGVQIEHRLPSRIFAHEPVVCRWVVRNKKSFFPSFTLRAVVQYPDMVNNQAAYFTHILASSTLFQTSTLTFGRRGIFRAGGYELSTAFPFGFFEKAVSIPVSTETVVYPKLNRLWTVQSGSLFTGDNQALRKKGKGPTLYNLRDYRHGDDSRNIHWKISARQSKLFVKEHEQEDERKVQIWLSNQLPVSSPAAQKEGSSGLPGLAVRQAGSKAGIPTPRPGAGQSGSSFHTLEVQEQFEEAVSLAASLAHAFAQKGYGVGLSTLDREIPPKPGMFHCNRILHHLAMVTLLSVESPHKNMDRLTGRLLSQAHQLILVLPWEDPFWKSRETSFTQIIIPSQWKDKLQKGGH
jgi:uncharacterized protein (DUF58 family)